INYGSISYFAVSPLDAGQFNPTYQYVLSRLPGIATARQTVARSDGVVLQRRTQPLDVTVDGGLLAPPELQDPNGIAWLTGVPPLRLIVAGPGTGTAYIGLRLTAPAGTQVPRQPCVRIRRHGTDLIVCLAAQGVAPYRFAQFIATPSPASPDSLLLNAMAVQSGSCPYR